MYTFLYYFAKALFRCFDCMFSVLTGGWQDVVHVQGHVLRDR
jgi:hypothetical protein